MKDILADISWARLRPKASSGNFSSQCKRFFPEKTSWGAAYSFMIH